jgi:hypothetical protein
MILTLAVSFATVADYYEELKRVLGAASNGGKR